MICLLVSSWGLKNVPIRTRIWDIAIFAAPAEGATNTRNKEDVMEQSFLLNTAYSNNLQKKDQLLRLWLH